MSAPSTSVTPVSTTVPVTEPTTTEPKLKQLKVPEERHKVKVNGKEIEVSIEDLKRSYGLDKASRDRFNESAKKIKEAEGMKEMFSKKEMNALLNAGWSEEEIERQAADFIINRAKMKNMTPEQRAQAEREQEYLKLKADNERRELAEKNKIKQDLEQREAKLYQKAFFSDIAKADKNTWLDLNDPIILSHVINYVSKSLTEHHYDMPVSEAVKLIEEQYEKRGAPKKEYWKKLSKFGIKDIDDNDLDTFYEKGAKGIRENSVAAIKKAEAPFAKNIAQTKSKTDSITPPVKYDAEYYKKEAQRYRDLRYNRTRAK